MYCPTCDRNVKSIFYNTEVATCKECLSFNSLFDNNYWCKLHHKKIVSKFQSFLIQSIKNSSLLSKIDQNKFEWLTGKNIDDFKRYIESLFKDGMTWENHGFSNENWQYDHIRPVSSFDLLNNIEIQKCWNWTNIQPLWRLENVKKLNKHNGTFPWYIKIRKYKYKYKENKLLFSIKIKNYFNPSLTDEKFLKNLLEWNMNELKSILENVYYLTNNTFLHEEYINKHNVVIQIEYIKKILNSFEVTIKDFNQPKLILIEKIKFLNINKTEVQELFKTHANNKTGLLKSIFGSIGLNFDRKHNNVAINNIRTKVVKGYIISDLYNIWKNINTISRN